MIAKCSGFSDVTVCCCYVGEEYYHCLGNGTYIFIGNGTSIVKKRLTGDNKFSWSTLVKTELRPLGIDVSIANCTLFYSVGRANANDCIGRIYAVSLTNSSNHTMIHDELGYPLQIAVNWITKRLYWCDYTLSTIEYSDFYGGNRAILLNNTKIRAIALDPCADDIHWISARVIFKMRLDGTNRSVIVSDNFKPNSVVIDFIIFRLYWAGASVIRTSDLKGENISTVYNTKSVRPTALSLYDNTLYWAEWKNTTIAMCTTSGMNIGTLVDNVKKNCSNTNSG